MDNCIFCKIAKGILPSTVLYEDDNYMAILDLFPASQGHALLIPKKHYVNMLDLPEGEGAEVYPLLSKLARSIKAATGCEGMNMLQNNGEIAGQVVFHSHIHLIPRNPEDGIKIAASAKKQAEPEAQALLAEKIRQALADA
jgi:histidine triad (HIT) family protein